MMKHLLILLFAFVLLTAFNNEVQSLFHAPNYFPKPSYDFKKNPLTKEKVLLGRVLFFDPLLSIDGKVSCASCHSPYNAFAHTDHSLSHGIFDSIGNRNAPALFNLAWQHDFMWDGAINHLDVQALAPISHPKEMGENINHLVEKLQSSSRYPSLFFKAFKDSAITGENLLKALAQFQLTLVSNHSKYDEVRQGKNSFSEQENKGYQLFLQNCNACHTEPLFTNEQFECNGLSVDTTLNDFGKNRITHLSVDSLVFKVPSLRNLRYTFPYMHDGRFKKLGQVLNHYTNNIQPHPNLSKELKNGIHLSSYYKADLIAFLMTLNDSSFVFNTHHQFPKEFF